MGNFQSSLFIVIMGIVSLVFVVLCYYMHIVTWITTWICSKREEKVGLTRLKGHFNANGYLVHSDSDIHLDCTGSFKRFDSVDKDFRINVTTTTLMEDWNNVTNDVNGASIPPQPLRPAPVPTTPVIKENSMNFKQFCEDHIEKTSISPIPRPTSSINMSLLASQSSFPVCITPPPTPVPSPNTSNIKFSLSTINSSPTTSMQYQQQAKRQFIYGNNGTNSSSYDSNSKETETIQLPEDIETITSTTILKRAISCDSVCSDTSVNLGDLEEVNVTGYLCIGLEYDSELCDLVVNVLEAKDLVGPERNQTLGDTYVKVFLLPDKEATIQTKVYKSSNGPSYKERFLFSLYPREQSQRSLCFHLYSTDLYSHTLIGEGEIRLADISLRQPVTTWITLTDTGQKGTEFGELMFSISYLPTAERLTVVVVKARNLKFQTDSPGDTFVKVYLMHQNKKIHKKKTSVKKCETSPIFNEAMMFSVPAHTLSTIQLRLTVAEVSTNSQIKAYPIGHVIVGAQATGRSLNHWNQMLTALRKPVAMWHILRK